MKEAGTAEEILLRTIPKEDIIGRLSRAALEAGLPLAVWRLPGQQNQQLLIDLSGSATAVFPALEELSAGFIFTPYNADLSKEAGASQKPSLLLKAHLHYNSEGEGELSFAPELSAQLAEKGEKLLQQAAEIVSGVSLQPLPYAVQEGQQALNTFKGAYCNLVEEAVSRIREEDFQKVVCARTKHIQLPTNFQPITFFNQLCQAYNNAFVSFVSIPGTGSWLGATPETLISIDRNQVFRTMALAGTQPKSTAPEPADAVWRQKEIEEQALVSRYIINCFKKIRLREFEELGPRTVVAGNLMHLRTDFKVDIKTSGFPELGSQMLSLLHPTSAVCGMPKAPAQAFLDAREALDRQFFAGFLGPVNLQQETSLFVNLRCMQLLRKEAVLYAGAGITADSKPEREWQETEHKCATLAAILEKS
jgi:isochorismate synthase